MSNVVSFPVPHREPCVARKGAFGAAIIPFRGQSSEGDHHFYASCLRRFLAELRAAQVAGKRRRVSDLIDEIDVLRLHSEWLGYRDIAGTCRNVLAEI